MDTKKSLIELTAEIVAAHASTSVMTSEALASELKSIHSILAGLSGGIEAVAETSEPEAVKPAISIRKAFKDPNFVLCMHCGGKFKSLRRHLSSAHGQTPREYRVQFNVPTSTKLVASSYSEQKSKFAKDKNLAQKLAEGREKRKKQKGAPKA
jgi:predicted transcriptional regulator